MSNSQKINWLVMIESYKERIKDIRNHDEEVDPLCIDQMYVYDITLSTGGPADGFRIYCDRRSKEPIKGCYYYSDWFWTEEEWLSTEVLDQVAERFGIGGW